MKMLPTKYLLFLFFITLTNSAQHLLFLIFPSIPGPLDELFNSSFHSHYGSYMDSTGIATVWSISTFAEKGGEIFGLLVLLRMVDTKGRKFGVIWLGFIISFSLGILYLFAYFIPSFEAFIVGAAFCGATMQLRWFALSILISESAPDGARGFSMMMMAFGDSIAAFIGTAILSPSLLGNSQLWIVVPGISLLILLISILYLAWVPESPRFLIEKKKYLEAEEAIKFYNGKHADTERILQHGILEQDKRGEEIVTFKELWTDECLRKIVILVFCLNNFFDISAMSVEYLFFTKIQILLGFNAQTAMTIGSIGKIMTIPLFLISSVLIEKWGRRPLILGGLSVEYFKVILMLIGMSLAYFSGTSFVTKGIAILSETINVLLQAIGPLQILSLLCCELSPIQARVHILQTVSLFSTIIGLIFSSLIPYAFNFMPQLPYLFLAIYQPFLIYHIYRNLPETTGRRLYDIVEDFTEAVRSRAPTRRISLIEEERLPLLK